ncbi:hypothetical protein B7R54_12395 [Subtercola boreus]|uniref:ABC transmembrane type-1 domain-containing protein n=1 Tax=Subtercola boreus TaxID=120213 RepID=A0A3E0VP28_9MICO|nr:hypothetical protein B7R54_12395 [Subtercola boreus]
MPAPERRAVARQRPSGRPLLLARDHPGDRVRRRARPAAGPRQQHAAVDHPAGDHDRDPRTGALHPAARHRVRGAAPAGLRADGLREGTAAERRHPEAHAAERTAARDHGRGAQPRRTAGGTVVVELVFNWPGIGQLLIASISQRDYAVVQAAILVIALFFVVVNFGVDLLYGVLDPRVRLR